MTTNPEPASMAPPSRPRRRGALSPAIQIAPAAVSRAITSEINEGSGS